MQTGAGRLMKFAANRSSGWEVGGSVAEGTIAVGTEVGSGVAVGGTGVGLGSGDEAAGRLHAERIRARNTSKGFFTMDTPIKVAG